MLRDLVRVEGALWWRTLPAAHAFALANVTVFGGRRRVEARRVDGALLWRVRAAAERVAEPCS